MPAPALDGWFTTGWFFWALAGVATMFVLNLSVSFFLSLYTAARAYELERRELAVLGMRLLRRLMSSPLDFVLPRKMEPEESDSTGRVPGKVGRIVNAVNIVNVAKTRKDRSGQEDFA